MKKILFILIAMFALAFISCKNETRIKAEREAFVRDSIAKAEREVFVRDSIAKAEREVFVQDSILKVERKATIKKLSNKFTYKKDEFSNTTWVVPKNRPYYSNENGVYCYFAMENDKPTINFRFRFQYYADDWLFIRNMIFNIDGENYTILPDMERDNNHRIWEWCDEHVGNSLNMIDENFIKKLAYASSVKVKLNGRQYYKIKTLTKSQLTTIRETYEYYIALGGTF